MSARHFHVKWVGRQESSQFPETAILDERGRKVCAFVKTWTCEHEPSNDAWGNVPDLDRPNGWTLDRPFGTEVQSGRDGKPYGASQRAHFFQSEGERSAWIESQVAKSLARAARKYEGGAA